MDQPGLEHESSTHRPYRPPIGIPTPGEPRAQATAASVVVHVLLALLILAPTLFYSSRLSLLPISKGAGGPGPSGGGGGGNAGRGYPSVHFTPERLQYVQVAPPAPKEKPKPEPPKPKPEEKKVVEPLKPTPPVPAPVEDPKPATSLAPAGLDPNGDGVGTGRDGSAGNGPGRGGGVGSGVGTGRGSGNGPGTGGGTDAIYPPTVVSLPILPLPVPSKVRPYKMVAEFEVDSVGNARLVKFNPSRDAGYNRRIREMLAEIRFRPAVRMDGTPVAAIAVVTAEAM